MTSERIFNSADYFVTSAGEPVRSVVTQSGDAVVVAWQVAPGQSIRAHVHPAGQDTWTILSGRGRYVIDKLGSTREVRAGDVTVATTGQVHGVINDGDAMLTFISVVAPSDAGYELVEAASDRTP